MATSEQTELSGSPTGVNMETGVPGDVLGTYFDSNDGATVVVFAVGNPGEKAMTPEEALAMETERPGSVGTVETAGVP